MAIADDPSWVKSRDLLGCQIVMRMLKFINSGSLCLYELGYFSRNSILFILSLLLLTCLGDTPWCEVASRDSLSTLCYFFSTAGFETDWVGWPGILKCKQ